MADYHANNAQIGYKVSQQRQQLQQIKGQLNQAQTAKRIKQVVTSLTPQVGLEEIKTPQTLKDQYLSQISQSEQSIQNQAKIAQTNQTQALIKNSVKWNLGALVSGTLFIWIWDLSDWARRKEY